MVRLAWLVALSLPGAVAAQVLDTSQGRIEFVGLQRCAPDELDRANTERCKAHWCAANLKLVLGFAEAAVFTLGPDAEVNKLVVVVEDAAHVRKKAAFEGAGELPAAWSEVAQKLAGEGALALDLALRWFPPLLEGGEPEARAQLEKLDWAKEQVPAVEAVWAFLRAHAAPDDLALALWHLDKNANVDARRLAAAQLCSFGAHDVAWWALADGMRDPDDRVNGICWSALRALANRSARAVDWRPALPALRAILAGTHCFGLADVCDVLARTQIDAALTPALLSDGGALLLGFAGARAEPMRARVRTLLAHLSGEPADAPVVRFAAWRDEVLRAEASAARR